MLLQRLLPKETLPHIEDVLAAYALKLNENDILSLAPTDAPAMLSASFKLYTALNECMHGQKMPISEKLDHFIKTQAKWRTSNRSEIRTQLLLSFARRTHDIVTCQREEMHNVTLLSIRKFSILCREPLKDILGNAPEILVIRRLPQSRFWGSGNLSIFRFMHEILMDAEFNVQLTDVLPKFTSKYRSITWNPLVVTEFLIDFRAVVMWPVRDPRALVELARMLDIENMPWPENLPDITQRIVPLLCSVLPDQQTAAYLDAEWRHRSLTQPVTEFLLGVACSVRHAFALVDLAQCHQCVRRHQRGFYPTRANVLVSLATHTRITETWLRKILQTSPLLYRVAMGDPFALVKLHDHAIVDYVVEGDFSYIPEVLIFDIHRLRAIHANIGSRAKDLCRLVDSDEPTPDDPLPLIQAAGVLRTIIFVCRFQHGECIVSLACSLAQQIIDAKRHLGVL